MVAVAFTGQQGLHRINMGQFVVTNARMGRRLNPTFWSNAVEPGDELSVTMILGDIEAEEGFCPYKSCGVSTAIVASTGGGKVCPKCFRFAAISKKDQVIHESRDEHRASESCSKPCIPNSDLELILVESAISEDIEEEKILHSSVPPENIELYHSIQVVQALFFNNYGSRLGWAWICVSYVKSINLVPSNVISDQIHSATAVAGLGSVLIHLSVLPVIIWEALVVTPCTTLNTDNHRKSFLSVVADL
jgi:hypothetical protein